MTPNEQAKELVGKYNDLLNPDIETYNCTEAKDCAIIAIELVLYAITEDATYWQQVKE